MHTRRLSIPDHYVLRILYAVVAVLLLNTPLSHAAGGSWTYYYDSEQIHLSQTTVSGSSVVAKVSDVNGINGSVLTRLDTDTGRFQWFFQKDISVENDRPSLIYKKNGGIVFWGSGIYYFDFVEWRKYSTYTFSDDNKSIEYVSSKGSFIPYFEDSFGYLYGQYEMRAHSSYDSGILIEYNGDMMQPEDSNWAPITVSNDRLLWRSKAGVQYALVNDVYNDRANWHATPLPDGITMGSEGPDGSMYFSGPGLGLIRYKNGTISNITGTGIADTSTVKDFWYEGGDVLWAATSEVLIRYDGQMWNTFPVTRDGYEIIDIDVEGEYVWVGTTNGLICFRYGDITGDVVVGEPNENVNVPEFATFDSGHPVQSSPAIGEDGTVYFGNDEGMVYALDPDMTEQWCTTLEAPVMSTPAVAEDGSVFLTSDKYLYKLIAGGTVAWRQMTDEEENYGPRRYGYILDSSPSIDTDGNVYIGNAGKYGMSVSCFNTYSALIWREEIPGYVCSAPALTADNAVVIGSAENYALGQFYYETGWGIHAFPQNGIDLPWSDTTGGNVSASPAIGANGTIFIGGEDGYMRAYTQTGDLLWDYHIGQMIQSSAAVGADGTIYVGSHDQHLYAFNSDGSLKWSYDAGAVIFSSPAIGSDGTIYFGARDGFVYALNPDGSLNWRYKTGGPVDSSPVLAPDGTLYIGSDDGNLYAFDTDTEGLSADAYWPCFKHDIARKGQSAEQSEKYMIVGRMFDGDNPLSGIIVDYIDESGSSNTARSTSDGWFDIYNMNPGTHEISLRYPGTTLFPYTTTATIIDSDVFIGNVDIADFPVKNYASNPWRIYRNMYDGTLYMFEGSQSNERILYAIDDDFQIKWQYNFGISTNYHSTAIGADGTIFVSTTYAIYAVRPDGSLKWEIDTDGNYQLAIASDGTIIASCQDNMLRFIDPENGHTVFSKSTTGWHNHSPVIGTDGSIHILESKSRIGKYTSNGELIRSILLSEACTSLALNYNNNLFVYGTNSGLTIYSSEGELLLQNYGSDIQTYSIAIDRDDTIYIGRLERIDAIDLDGTVKWQVAIPPHRYIHGENKVEAISLGEQAMYVATADDHVMAINYDGTIKWYENSGKENYPLIPIIREDGIAYLGDHIRLLQVDIGETGVRDGAPWPYTHHDPRHTYNISTTPDTTVEQQANTPSAYITTANYPNPFNPSTTISYSIPTQANVTLSIFTVTGQMVQKVDFGIQHAGNHLYRFNGSGYPSGVYLYQVQADRLATTGRMLLMK